MTFVDLTHLDRAWDLDPDVLGRFEFSFTTHEPYDSRKNRFCREWAEVIYQATRGGVNIVNFPSATLVSSADALAAVRLGTADFAWTIGPNWITHYPILGMLNMAVLGLDAPTMATHVMWDLLEENMFFQNEMMENAGARLALLYSTGGTGIHSNVPIRTLDDFRGLSIRVLPGTGVDIVNRLGAAPAMMGPPDIYESMARGVIQGYAIDWTGITAFNLYEVTDFFSTHGLWQTPMMILMNTRSYNSLPPEYQEVLDYYSGREMSLQHAWVWELEVHEESQRATPDQFITFSDEDWNRLVEMGKEYNYERVAGFNIPGFDAPGFLDRIYEIAQGYHDSGWKYYLRTW
jgi:TRAP-type C4-dicarboxylate transport system substrate-binding protein